MHVVDQPIRFLPGDVCDPADINALMLYAQDALDDVTSRRFQHGTLVLPFVKSVTSPYDETTALELRTLRFICPVTCVVTGAYLTAIMESSAEVKVTIETLAGATPAGATVPWLTTKGALVTDPDTDVGTVSATGVIASSDDDVTATNTNRVLLLAGVEYKIVVATVGAATFDLYRFDVELHTLTDRWTTADVDDRPSFDPVLLTEASMRDADVVNTNRANFAAAVADVGAGAVLGAVEAPVPLLFVLHDIISTSDVDARTLILPRFDPARAQARILRVVVFAAMSDGLGTTIRVTLNTPGGATFADISVAGLTQVSSSLADLNESLVGDAGDTVDDAEDFTIILANASATTTALKLYCLVWISR